MSLKINVEDSTAGPAKSGGDDNGVDEYALAYIKRCIDQYQRLEEKLHKSNAKSSSQVSNIVSQLNKGADKIDLDGPVGDSGLVTIATALKNNKTAEYLRLSNTKGELGVIVNALQSNTTVKELYLENTPLSSAVVEAIGTLLQTNSNIKVLSLSNGELYGEALSLLLKSLEANTGVTTLKLCGNKPGMLGVKALVAFCTKPNGNRTLKELHLADCDITDAEADVVASVLSSHETSLSLLSLSDNDHIANSAMELLSRVGREGGWFQVGPLEFVKPNETPKQYQSPKAAHKTATAPSPIPSSKVKPTASPTAKPQSNSSGAWVWGGLLLAAAVVSVAMWQRRTTTK